MNTDIQRIAEKWAEGYKDPQVSAYEVIKAALEELSALRDTQERELREKVEDDFIDLLLANLRDRGFDTDNWDGEDDPASIIADRMEGEVSELRAELARRDEVEGELREKLSVAEADVQTILSPFLKKEDELEEENASLRSKDRGVGG